MGFGLNTAPSIMQAIVEATLSKDDAIQQATSAYNDDVYINEDIASSTRVRKHLANFGLVSKELERLQNGSQPLGLTVREEGNMLIWERRNKVSKRATCSYQTQHVLVLWKANRVLPSG